MLTRLNNNHVSSSEGFEVEWGKDHEIAYREPPRETVYTEPPRKMAFYVEGYKPIISHKKKGDDHAIYSGK